MLIPQSFYPTPATLPLSASVAGVRFHIEFGVFQKINDPSMIYYCGVGVSPAHRQARHLSHNKKIWDNFLLGILLHFI
jgi:hypothetical protein